MEVAEGKTVFDARSFAVYWFDRESMTAKKATMCPSLFNTFYLDYEGLLSVWRFNNPKAKATGLKKDLLQAAFSEFIERELKKERLADLARFRCTGENLNPILTWLEAVTGKQDERDLAVLAHWVWGVKRKSLELPVKHSVMPILYGVQGCGKSMALQKLIEPLLAFKMSMRMTQLGDERVFEGLSQNLIVLFDELQGIERTDLNVLKNQITTTFNTYRKLHTHAVVNVPMSCSFIGATNKHINESFSDSTGMRRFYEMSTLKKIDWSAINEIDYTALWLGIDETLENGYLTGPMLEAVSALQVELVNEDDMELFIRDMKIAEPGQPLRTVTGKQMYAAYQQWCIDNGMKSVLNYPWLSRKLINKDIPIVMRKEGGKLFEVSANCLIGQPGTILTFNKEEA